MLNDTDLSTLDTLVLWSLLGTTEMLLRPESVNVSQRDRDGAVTLQSRLLVELSSRGLTMADRPANV
jgi:hypothetical protein